jgi:acetyl esterase/lipase
MVLKKISKGYPLLGKLFLGILIIFAAGSCTDEEDQNPLTASIAAELIDQPYGSETVQSLDVYLPAGRSIEKTPLLIYIHGGAWIGGSKKEFDEFRGSLMESFPGYAFVSLGYRLYDLNTGSNPFPTQQLDVKNAIEYIVGKAESWQISKDIILAGASAGGHLALLHAYKHQSIGNPKAIVAFFPPTDLASLYSFNEFTKLGLRGMLGGTPEENPDGYAINSPITYIKPSSPPTIFFHGSIDSVVPISQSELLASVLAKERVAHEFVTIPNQGHGFTKNTYPALFERASVFVEKALE